MPTPPTPPPLGGEEGVCRGCVCVRAFLRSCVREEHGFFPGHPSVLGRRDTFTNRVPRARSRQTGTRVCTLLTNQGRAAETRPGRLQSRRARGDVAPARLGRRVHIWLLVLKSYLFLCRSAAKRLLLLLPQKVLSAHVIRRVVTLFLGPTRAEWLLWCVGRVGGFWTSFRRVSVWTHQLSSPTGLATGATGHQSVVVQSVSSVLQTDAIVTGVCLNHVTSRGQSLPAGRFWSSYRWTDVTSEGFFKFLIVVADVQRPVYLKLDRMEANG